jgi:hypothetical protein
MQLLRFGAMVTLPREAANKIENAALKLGYTSHDVYSTMVGVDNTSVGVGTSLVGGNDAPLIAAIHQAIDDCNPQERKLEKILKNTLAALALQAQKNLKIPGCKNLAIRFYK